MKGLFGGPTPSIFFCIHPKLWKQQFMTKSQITWAFGLFSGFPRVCQYFTHGSFMFSITRSLYEGMNDT